MKVIIVGAGNVGLQIARQLIAEKKDVVLIEKDFERMRWGLDKRGNFDLLFEAARIGNKIMEIPIHYQAKQSGERKAKTLLNGLLLLKACVQGFRKLVLNPKK